MRINEIMNSNFLTNISSIIIHVNAIRIIKNGNGCVSRVKPVRTEARKAVFIENELLMILYSVMASMEKPSDKRFGAV